MGRRVEVREERSRVHVLHPGGRQCSSWVDAGGWVWAVWCGRLGGQQALRWCEERSGYNRMTRTAPLSLLTHCPAVASHPLHRCRFPPTAPLSLLTHCPAVASRPLPRCRFPPAAPKHTMSEHTMSEHTMSEHTMSEHTRSEHTRSEHTRSEHTRSEHTRSEQGRVGSLSVGHQTGGRSRRPQLGCHAIRACQPTHPCQGAPTDGMHAKSVAANPLSACAASQRNSRGAAGQPHLELCEQARTRPAAVYVVQLRGARRAAHGDEQVVCGRVDKQRVDVCVAVLCHLCLAHMLVAAVVPCVADHVATRRGHEHAAIGACHAHDVPAAAAGVRVRLGGRWKEGSTIRGCRPADFEGVWQGKRPAVHDSIVALQSACMPCDLHPRKHA
eukprot:364933-Chlamydomonas_euryale.AAC.28